MLKGERQPVPQESEYTPEQIERIKFLLVQFETGIDFDNNEEQAKNCIGLHGTSLDAFLPLITDGVTRGTSQTDDGYAQDNIHPGDLYFYPRFSAIPNKVKDILFFDPNVKQLYAEARGKPYSSIESDTDIYAKIIAKQHQLLTQLGFDLNCSDDIRHAVIELVSHVKISNPKKTEIDTAIYSKIEKYFQKSDSTTFQGLFKELESLKVKKVKVSNINVFKKITDKDTLDFAKFNVEYIGDKNKSIGNFERSAQYTLVSKATEKNKEFKFYFIKFYSDLLKKDSTSVGVTR